MSWETWMSKSSLCNKQIRTREYRCLRKYLQPHMPYLAHRARDKILNTWQQLIASRTKGIYRGLWYYLVICSSSSSFSSIYIRSLFKIKMNQLPCPITMGKFPMTFLWACISQHLFIISCIPPRKKPANKIIPQATSSPDFFLELLKAGNSQDVFINLKKIFTLENVTVSQWIPSCVLHLFTNQYFSFPYA